MSRRLRPERQPEMPALLRRQHVPVLGPVKVVPPWTGPALRAEYGSYRKARTGKISQIEVSTLSGEPRSMPQSCRKATRVGGTQIGGRMTAAGSIVSNQSCMFVLKTALELAEGESLWEG